MDRRYSKTHEWVAIEDGDLGTVGISEYAVEQLGDVVYVELPAVGTVIAAGGLIGEIESVKAVSQIYSPVSGEIVATNENLVAQPELVNSSPLDKGWMAKLALSDRQEWDGLLTRDQYEKQRSDQA